MRWLSLLVLLTVACDKPDTSVDTDTDVSSVENTVAEFTAAGVLVGEYALPPTGR